MTQREMFGLLLTTLALGLLLAACGGGDAVNHQTDVTDGDTSATDGDQDSDKDSESEVASCTPGDMKCLGNDIAQCSGAGAWEFYRSCTDVGKTCVNAECVTADGDSDGDTNTGVTVGGSCTTAGARDCAGTLVVRCASNASGAYVWTSYIECPSDVYTCESGACKLKSSGACTISEDSEDSCSDGMEYCLPATAGGTSGSCVPNCNLANSGCPKAWQCSGSKCTPVVGYCESNADCELTKYCKTIGTETSGICTTHCYERGQSCPQNFKCTTNSSDVNYGRCVPIDATCTSCDSSPNSCPSGQYCELVSGQSTGCCRSYCTDSSTCATGLVCRSDHTCGVDGAAGCSTPCATGQVCDTNWHQCVLNCPTCPVNYTCDAASAPNCYQSVCVNPTVCGLLMPNCCGGYKCSTLVYGVEGVCVPQ